MRKFTRSALAFETFAALASPENEKQAEIQTPNCKNAGASGLAPWTILLGEASSRVRKRPIGIQRTRHSSVSFDGVPVSQTAPSVCVLGEPPRADRVDSLLSSSEKWQQRPRCSHRNQSPSIPRESFELCAPERESHQNMIFFVEEFGLLRKARIVSTSSHDSMIDGEKFELCQKNRYRRKISNHHHLDSRLACSRLLIHVPRKG